jgi:hypothetical protein
MTSQTAVRMGKELGTRSVVNLTEPRVLLGCRNTLRFGISPEGESLPIYLGSGGNSFNAVFLLSGSRIGPKGLDRSTDRGQIIANIYKSCNQKRARRLKFVLKTG